MKRLILGYEISIKNALSDKNILLFEITTLVSLNQIPSVKKLIAITLVKISLGFDSKTIRPTGV